MTYRMRVLGTIALGALFLTMLTATKKKAPSRTTNGVEIPDPYRWPEVPVPSTRLTVRLPPNATIEQTGDTGFTIELASGAELRYAAMDPEPDTHALKDQFFPNEILYHHDHTFVVRFGEPRASQCQLVACSAAYPRYCVVTLKTKLRHAMADCVTAIAIARGLQYQPEPASP